MKKKPFVIIISLMVSIKIRAVKTVQNTHCMLRMRIMCHLFHTEYVSCLAQGS